MILRCYNCGIQMHKTQNCPSYGPRYPAPGKTGQDYAAEADRIMALFAADIIAEHESDGDADDDRGSWFAGSKLSSREAAGRGFPCGTCGADIGQPCHSKGGQRTACHKSRYSRIAVEEASHGH